MGAKTGSTHISANRLDTNAILNTIIMFLRSGFICKLGRSICDIAVSKMAAANTGSTFISVHRLEGNEISNENNIFIGVRLIYLQAIYNTVRHM